jgi:hypothetical protein
MSANLSSDIMAELSKRLSMSVADMAKQLQKPETEITAAVQELENDQMVHRASDSVTKATLLSPTSKGILAARGLSKYAF